MAIFHVRIKSVSRGAGSSSVGRAAYILRDRLRDEVTRHTYDYRQIAGLEHRETLLPVNAPQRGVDWTRSPASLWNQAERAERLRNARVAREYVFSLPHELNSERRLTLARLFAQDIADQYRGVVNFAVHRPPIDGDPRNHHVHVLSTTRELTASGLGRKTVMELSDTDRREQALPGMFEEFKIIRERIAGFTNAALLEAGLDVRVDHRSLRAQGLERRPKPRRTHVSIIRERRAAQLEQLGSLRQVASASHGETGDRSLLRAAEPAMPPVISGRPSKPLGVTVEREPTSDDLRMRGRATWMTEFYARSPAATVIAAPSRALSGNLKSPDADLSAEQTRPRRLGGEEMDGTASQRREEREQTQGTGHDDDYGL